MNMSTLRCLRQCSRYALRADLAGLVYFLSTSLRGLDLGKVSAASLGLAPETGEEYQDGGGPHLPRVLRRLALPREWHALDFGSGKGGALIALGRWFAQVHGVEYSASLVAKARRNLARVNATNVTMEPGDARGLLTLDRFQVFHFFNPFGPEVMATVLANIAASLQRAPRPIVAIYNNPECEAQFVDAGWEHWQQFEWRGYPEVLVFRITG